MERVGKSSLWRVKREGKLFTGRVSDESDGEEDEVKKQV